jgi:hypothetical protein
MLKDRQNLRNVVAIAICLAGVTMFSGCDKNNGSDGVEVKESWVEFAGEKYYWFSVKHVTHTYDANYDPQIHPNYGGTAKPHGWGFTFAAGRSSTDVGNMTVITLAAFGTDTKNPNGSYRITASITDLDNSFQQGNFNVCGPGCLVTETVMLHGMPTATLYNIISGTLEVNKNGNTWTINMNGTGKDENGNTKPVAFSYRGELALGYGSDPI